MTSTEESALAASTRWVNGAHRGHLLYGYLPVGAANFLVGTGRYCFWQACCWGYIVERVAEDK